MPQGVRGDDNPFVQVGDAVVLGPTLLLDVRYGVSRINTKNLSGDKTGFNDYDSFGVPENLQPSILFPGVAPNVNPNGFAGGAAGGGGNNWSALTTGNFNTKQEYQTSHSIAASATKTRGAWIHKAGFEFRNLLSNYADPEQGSVALPSPFAQVGGNFNFEYVTANGGVASLTRTNAQRGVNAAGPLLGAGLWWIRPGANVTPAFSQKYFAIYSQNDWRATTKLTLNLGLRWEVQPGPTERFDRMSSWDLEAPERVRHAGRDRVSGRRRLQPQPVGHELRQLRPPPRCRLPDQRPHGAAGRLRHHLPAEQHRLFLGADRLRLRELLGRCQPGPVRADPRGCAGRYLRERCHAGAGARR